MALYRQLTTVCLLLLPFLSLLLAQSCVRVRPEDGGLFVATPQTPSPALTECSAFSSSACCTSSYTDLVAAKTDKVHQNITNHFSGLSESCASIFNELSCSFCSPNQGDFIHAIPTQSIDKFAICETYCDRIYQACSGATLASNSTSLGDLYKSGKDFCESDYFWSIFYVDLVAKDSPIACFNGNISTRLCTSDDFQGEYTTCNPATNTRKLIYTWNPNVDCHGGVSLPPAIDGLPCDVACVAGQYLPMGQTACRDCDPGYYSIGGGIRVDYWADWPQEPGLTLTTDCTYGNRTGSQGCSPWTLDDTFITSGDNREYNNITTRLIARFTLVRPGYIKFKAKVDAEKKFDQLHFKIGDEVNTIIDSAPQFEEFEYDLASGPYVVTWEYIKDFSQSAGEDTAFISLLEIGGTKYADDSCTICSPGKFSNSVGAAECMTCPVNKIPRGTPPTSCGDCPAHSYALPGFDECEPSEKCTKDDYTVNYSECGLPLPGNRNTTFHWKFPKICDDSVSGAVTLPPAGRNLPCEPCNAGEFQDLSTAKCKYCDVGYYSNVSSSSCSICPPGTVATKNQIYNTWSSVNWPVGWSTHCDHCDTEGWRINYDSLDAGEGTDSFASYLDINETFYTAGYVEINGTLECPKDGCGLFLWINDKLSSWSYSTGITEPKLYRLNVPNAGSQHIKLDFTRFSPTANRLNTTHLTHTFTVESIVLSGTQKGGAPRCVKCPAGTTSGEGAVTCITCGAGQYANEDTGTCSPCLVDTMNPRNGSAEGCVECGTGTSTLGLTGQTDCDNNGCIYTVTTQSSNKTLSFDLSALTKNDSMWGSIYDPTTGQAYYINVCSNDHENHSCHYADGSPMPTYACQVTPQGASNDLGSVLNFDYNEEEDSLNIVYTHGSWCTWGDQHLGYRNTTLKFICDPYVTSGFPSSPEFGIEDPRCNYTFEWNTIYGCHLCTEDDYFWYWGRCENNQTYKHYSWKASPKRCHSGTSLPPTEGPISGCATNLPNKICQDGEYISSTTMNCTSCPVGNYSIGNGQLVEYWNGTELSDSGFSVFCEKDNIPVDNTQDCVGGWNGKGFSIVTIGTLADGTSTVLYAERNFKEHGSVEFEFNLITEFGEPLEFLIDHKVIFTWNVTVMQGLEPTRVNVTPGTHSFKWRFSPFHSDKTPRSATIWSVLFRGTSFSQFQCTPCPWSLISNSSGSSLCSPCPLNYKYDSPSTCLPCRESEFSLNSDPYCHIRPACLDADYVETFTPCKDGKRSSTTVLAQPVICQSTTPPVHKTDLPCRPCAQGYYRNGDDCVTCQQGTYYDENQKSCKQAGAGMATVNVQHFFSDYEKAQFYTEWPDSTKWKTGCSGYCGTDGWRLMGTFIDSGAHFGQVYSWVELEEEFSTDGLISFLVAEINRNENNQEGDADDEIFEMGDFGFEFFIDGIPQTSQIGNNYLKFPVTKGNHSFLWVHSQSKDQPEGALKMLVKDITLQGVKSGQTIGVVCPAGYSSKGGNSLCEKCPPGTYSSSNSASCVKCPPHTFSSDSGSSECLSCGSGTSVNSEGTNCDTNACSFNDTVSVDSGDSNVDQRQYFWDFSALSSVVVNVISQTIYSFTLNICHPLPEFNLDINPCGSKTFVCLQNKNTHEPIPAGKILSFKAIDNKGVAFTYSHGNNDGCPTGVNRTTRVEIYCELFSVPYGGASVVDQPTNNQDTCSYSIVLMSRHACPRCTSSDLEKRPGECVGGIRKIDYISKINCLDPLPPFEESCEEVEVNEFAIVFVVLVVVVVVAILSFVALYMYLQKRKLHARYSSLILQGESGLEMDDIVGKEEDSTAI